MTDIKTVTFGPPTAEQAGVGAPKGKTHGKYRSSALDTCTTTAAMSVAPAKTTITQAAFLLMERLKRGVLS